MGFWEKREGTHLRGVMVCSRWVGWGDGVQVRDDICCDGSMVAVMVRARRMFRVLGEAACVNGIVMLEKRG